MHGTDSATAPAAQVDAARQALDACVREMVEWHFDPATGCPFWLDYAQKLGWDPRGRLRLSPISAVSGVRGRMAARRTGAALGAARPGREAGLRVRDRRDDGTPKTRVACDDFRTDYEIFSSTLPDEYFPKAATG
jgi:hypothetical protein